MKPCLGCARLNVVCQTSPFFPACEAFEKKSCANCAHKIVITTTGYCKCGLSGSTNMASYFCNNTDWAPRKIEEKKPTRAKDSIEHPAHYTHGSVEVWDAIEAWRLGYLEGNIIKYVARAKYKGDELSDLRKARQYLNRVIEKLEASK